MKDFKDELPMGLGFSLSMNQKAMERFSGMSDPEKMQVIEKSRQVTSKKEMEKLINRLEEGSAF